MMRLICFVLISVTGLLSLSASAGTVVWPAPNEPDPSAKYMFYMHGRNVAGKSDAENSFRQVVKAIASRGFVVITELRVKGTIKRKNWPGDYEKYAKKVATEVNALLERGVPAGNIIVSGYSRGGLLTIITSAILGNPDLNYIIMAGCMSERGAYKQAVPTVHERYSPKLKGRFLSLRDTGDEDFGSCSDYFDKADVRIDYKEVSVTTGNGHQAFYKPMEEWLKPLVEWTGVRAK